MPLCALPAATIYYESAGDGPPVLLLHHATGSVRSWRHQLAPLLQGRRQVIAYDRPGFGRSSERTAWALDYLDEDVAELIALLDALQIERAALLGHSDGASIALLAAARHPQRVSRVLAEAPHVTAGAPRCATAVAQLAAELLNSAQGMAAAERAHGPRAAAVIERWRNRWCDPAFWRWDVSAELTGIRCPVRVVHGLNDPFFAPQHAEQIAQLAHGELHLLPGLGHTPHSEAPQRFNALLDFFLTPEPA
ncbi:MAG: alpha/beta fold hydrolase [Caldilineales bacterium]